MESKDDRTPLLFVTRLEHAATVCDVRSIHRFDGILVNLLHWVSNYLISWDRRAYAVHENAIGNFGEYKA
jgi:hypothetical protein